MQAGKSQLLLWILILVNATVALMYPNPISSILPTCFYIVIAARLFVARPAAFLLFSPLILMHFSVLLSLIAIEAGAFMKEVGRYGYPSAASAVYVIFTGVFLSVASAVFPKNISNEMQVRDRVDPARHPLLLQWAAFLIMLFIVFFLLLKGALTGFPLVEGYDRFAYRRVMGDPITLSFLNMKMLLAAFLGLSAAQCSTRFGKWRHHGVFMVYLLVSFLFADKFFAIINSILYYAAVQLAFKPDLILKQTRKFALAAVLAVSLATVMTVYIYSGKGVLGVEATAERLMNRFAEQGQLWFVAFNNHPDFVKFDSGGVKENLLSLVQSSGFEYSFDKRLAGFYFLQKYAPAQMYFSFLSNQGYVSPIMVFVPYLLELLGFGGVLLGMVVGGAILGVLGGYMMRAIASGNPFRIVLPTFIMVQFYFLIVSGTLYVLLSVGRIAAYSVLFLFQLAMDFWFSRASLSYRRDARRSASRAAA